MPADAVVRYLDYRLREMEEMDTYRAAVVMHLSVIGSGARLKQPFNYIEQLDYIYGRKQQDKRSAAEIIADTAKSFGVKIV